MITSLMFKNDGNLQTKVLSSLKQRKLTLLHHPLIEEQPSQRQMHDTVECGFFWPHVENDVSHTV